MVEFFRVICRFLHVKNTDSYIFNIKRENNDYTSRRILDLFWVIYHNCCIYLSLSFTSGHFLQDMVNFRQKFNLIMVLNCVTMEYFVVVLPLLLCKYLEFRLFRPLLKIRFVNMHGGWNSQCISNNIDKYFLYVHITCIFYPREIKKPSLD